MRNFDSSKFYKIIQHLPQQIKESELILEKVSFSKIPDSFNRIVIIGMGGSAIAGDLLMSYLQDELDIPILLNRNYKLPNYIGPKTLVLACSYSGNTEETLTAVGQAFERGSTVVAIASGGRLEEIAKEKAIPFIQIPPGFPPRQALGYLFFSLLYIFTRIGIIESKKDETNETYDVLKNISERNGPQKTHGHNFCNLIAQKLYKKIPVVYTASELLYPVVVRWRNQFNENSKVLAFSNVFPELNHNEIMGWEAMPEVLSCFTVLLLRDKEESHRNKARLEITRDLLRKDNFNISEVFGEGRSRLARMFSQIYIGDWVSYYLAGLYGKDPLKIKSIDYLKKSLSKLK